MKSSPLISRSAKQVSLGCIFCFLMPLLPFSVTAQEPTKPVVIDNRPKYGMLLVIGYEMEKERADTIVQKQDMTQNVGETVKKLEVLTKTGGASHSSCAAQIIRSGTRSSLEMGGALLEIEGTIGASGDFIILSMRRTDKANGTQANVRATMKVGDYAFIGTVPGVKPDKDQLLFVRCLMHYLD